MKQILEKVRDKVPKNRNFHEVKRAFNKISAPLKIKVVQGNEKKRKLSETEKSEEATEAKDDNEISMMEVHGDVESKENGSNQKKDKKKKKKKKHNKEGLQKKKEKKRQELEDQYKNVDLPSFKGALVDTINIDENIDVPKKKKTNTEDNIELPKK